MEIQVWVGDLAEYNNGKLIGEWFTLPMDISDILDQVLVEGNEEYYIGDTDSQLEVRNMSLSEMNELAEKLESLYGWEQEALSTLINSGYFNGIDEAFECFEAGDYRIYNDCSDMSDVAYAIYEETGQLQELEKHINAFYIDWNAIGRDMNIEGYFFQVDHSTYLEIIC